MKTPIQLTLELDPSSEPIRGRLCLSGDGAASMFSGYLGLISAIEAARSTEAQAPPFLPEDPGAGEGEG